MTLTGGWTFNGFGPGFDTHVAAHLPGYMDAQRLIALVAEHYLPAGGVLADYGASTGRTLEVIQEALPGRPFEAHLFDQDASMLEEAAARAPDAHLHQCTMPTGGPPQCPPVDLSVALWFLQFLPPREHRAVLAEIRAASAPTGALLIATKTRHVDSRWQDVAVAALDDYKAEQGVTPEERVQKTRALRGALHAIDVDTLTRDLTATGWGSPTLLWRWHVWSIIGAFADGR